MVILFRKYFCWLRGQLGFKVMEDWYKLSAEAMLQNCGASLGYYYKGSPSKALMDVYPEHDWKLWKFGSLPKRFWNPIENQRQYFDWLKLHLGYSDMEDWYKVTIEDFHRNGGSQLLHRYYKNSLPTALQTVYPEHHWDLDRWCQTNKLANQNIQNFLERQLLRGDSRGRALEGI